ncbi:hypothetical protein SADUNF_Sadunf15G0109000 [Salix dunnii]|uniref:Uncharacterized protein n=1 Tax=Salix dunnii TaxID=1413687 RepID=A0A835JJG0_9ROSI|nr:hypothetical protein SADUNF_Sadunf15G0109000 [Salix dunnii]
MVACTVFGHQGPANLLIHGFGAFLERYRDDIHSISKMRTDLGYYYQHDLSRLAYYAMETFNSVGFSRFRKKEFMHQLA